MKVNEAVVLEMATLFVNVKFSSTSSCPLEAYPNSSVGELKSLISDKTGVSRSDLQLILAGKVLQDSQTLNVSQSGLRVL